MKAIRLMSLYLVLIVTSILKKGVLFVCLVNMLIAIVEKKTVGDGVLDIPPSMRGTYILRRKILVVKNVGDGILEIPQNMIPILSHYKKYIEWRSCKAQIS